jgi:hypothetical protein
VLLALTFACAPPDSGEGDSGVVDSAGGGPAAPLTVPLDPPALLRRMSLDLRGALPSLDELARVEADPAALDTIEEEMLQGPAFESRFADLVAEQFLTRVDAFNVGAVDLGLPESEERALVEDVGNEVPVFLAAVAAQDLPWTETVRADWTVTTERLTAVWPVEVADGPGSSIPGWSRARYTDGRPAGGVVMQNGMWWRYWSAPNNYNRTRAAAIGRLLLCDDWLTRPVAVANLASIADSFEDAVRNEPSCVACHNSLDPIAAAMFGFWWFDLYAPLEMSSYHPERERVGERYLDVAPAWFGRNMDGPVDLGDRIAEDPRFFRCAAQRAAAAYWRRPIEDEDFVAITALQAEFEAGGWTMRPLIRAVLATEEYRAGGLLPEAPDATPVATRRVVQPGQLATMVEQVTGYAWTLDDSGLLWRDDVGYRVLAGGVDGASVTLPSEDPSVTREAVLLRLAEAASAFVVGEDFVRPPADRTLLTEVATEDTPSSEAFRAQLTTLHRRLEGRSPTDEELAEEVALAEALAAEGLGAEEIWRAEVELFLRDPAFWTY